VAIRIDASGDYLRRTANLPTSSSFTACCWFYYVNTRSAYAFFIGLEDATSSASQYLLIGFEDTNAFHVAVNSGGAVPYFGSNPATSAWHFMAIRANGTNVKGFHRTLAGTWQTVTSSTAPLFTPAMLTLGNDSWDEWTNCRLAGIKVWDAALTDAEIENEAETLTPQRFENINLWVPGFPGSGERTRDYSGNGRNLTEGGTLTDEDPPPVAWGGRTLFFPFAAGGSTQFATFSATGTGSAAFIKVPTKLFAPVTGTGTPTFSKAPAKIVPTVTANGAASFVKVPTKIIATLIAAGTATFTTVKTKVVTFALVTATGAASFIKAPLKIIALTGTGGASFVKVPTRIISPLTATGSASFLKTPTKIIALSATGAATFTTLKVKLVSFVVTATGSVSFLKTPTKIIALSASGAASFTKVPTKVISPLTATGAATFTTLKVRLVTFALVTATGTATFLKTPQKVFSASATGAPTFVKSVSRLCRIRERRGENVCARHSDGQRGVCQGRVQNICGGEHRRGDLYNADNSVGGCCVTSLYRYRADDRVHG